MIINVYLTVKMSRAVECNKMCKIGDKNIHEATKAYWQTAQDCLGSVAGKGLTKAFTFLMKNSKQKRR